MASAAPPPNSSATALPPASTSTSPSTSSPPPTTSSPPQQQSSTSPPPQTFSPSPPPPSPSPTSPPSQPSDNPPDAAIPPTSSPPPPSPPPVVPAAPPPTPLSRTPPPLAPTASTPPPTPAGTSPPLVPAASPPPPSPPVTSPPLAPTRSPPPPQSDPPTSPSPPSSNVPPPSISSPPPKPSSSPPESSSPPPSKSSSPASSPPPPPSRPPVSSSPPPPVTPPVSSPPPTSKAPRNPPPPPSSSPPKKSTPPPAPAPTESSPPPPASTPPKNSTPPASLSPSKAPPPPTLTPSGSEPTPSPSTLSPPPTIISLAPPPPSHDSPPSPNQNTIPPSVGPSASDTNTTATERSNSTGNGGIGTAGLVAIVAVTGIIVLSLIGVAIWCISKRKERNSGFGRYVMPSPLGSSPRADSPVTKTHSSAPLIQSGSGSDSVYSSVEMGGLGNSRSWFTYEELVRATNGFSDQNLLGEGGFGSVYKGYLPDGREIAVKQLRVGSSQGEREFKAEVEIISRIHHRHLVSLVGYCISENQRLLIYDYVPNNNLYFHLHGEGGPVLDWATRVKVAAGAARGIAYLHEDCHPRIIHRDIKSSNILLDNNFEARVSDFGLAKLALDANTHVTTRVIGTFGYVAPEYASSGKLTDKSDVYSFGVVLLELITGRKPVDASQPLGDESLVEWARPLLSQALDGDEFEDLADPRLNMEFVESEMLRMIEIAAACVRHSSAKRPRMGQVVRAFDCFAVSDLTNGMRFGESEVFNSAQQSAEIRLFRRMAFGSQNFSIDFFSHSSVDS